MRLTHVALDLHICYARDEENLVRLKSCKATSLPEQTTKAAPSLISNLHEAGGCFVCLRARGGVKRAADAGKHTLLSF